MSEPLKDRCTILPFSDVPLERMQKIIAEYAAEKIRRDYPKSLVLRNGALRNGVQELYKKGIHSVRQHKNLIDNSFKQAYSTYLLSVCETVAVTDDIFAEQVRRLCGSGVTRRWAGFQR